MLTISSNLMNENAPQQHRQRRMKLQIAKVHKIRQPPSEKEWFDSISGRLWRGDCILLGFVSVSNANQFSLLTVVAYQQNVVLSFE